MTEDPVIQVHGVSKAYHIWRSPAARLKGAIFTALGSIVPPLKEFFAAQAAAQFRDFYALKDISFEVRKGESVGIIGRNGSGKSTLLQIIAGTLQPSAGTVNVNGRVAALLELGSGFNPEFTGRENVYLNGTVLGLTRRDVDERFDRITAFADIGDFIEQPVKTYSSGMVIRLAFAVAINVDAEIMIIDEALSVGDMNFQAKCITALRQLQRKGAAFLIVTHGTEVVKSMCERAIYLRGGWKVQAGSAAEVANTYFREMREQLSAEIARSQISPNCLPTVSAAELSNHESGCPVFRRDPGINKITTGRSGTGEGRITAVEIFDVTEQAVNVFDFGANLNLRIHLEIFQDLEFLVGYHIRDEHCLSILCTGTYTELGSVISGKSGTRFVIDFNTPLPLKAGRYNVAALISTRYIQNTTAQFVDWVEPAAVFEVLPRDPQVVWGAVYLKNEVKLWNLGP